MKTLALALLLFLPLAAPCEAAGAARVHSPAGGPTGTSSRAFRALEQRYLDGLFRAKPYLADYMGDHRFAQRLSDPSPSGVARRVKELRAQRRELAALDRAALAVDERVDASILEDGLGLELLELTEVREWTWNPGLVDTFTWYDPREVVASRLSGLAHGDWGTPGERLRALTAQLRALPAWLAERERALRAVSAVHLDQAVLDNRGRIAFVEEELAPFTRGDAGAERARLAAVKALRGYQAFMKRELPRLATRSWRLGPGLYARKFPLALQTRVTPEELTERAREDFAVARGELFALSRRLSAELFPGEPVPGDGAAPAEQARLIGRVRDALALDHPAPEALVEAHAEKLGALRAFVEEKGLIPLPPPETLTVAEMPEFKRGGGGAEYLSPGFLDRSRPFHGTYYVEPVDPSWPAGKVESYLRANNDYEVTLTAAHEALPGHHAQAWWARRDPSALQGNGGQ